MDKAICEFDLGYFNPNQYVVWINGQKLVGPSSTTSIYRVDKTPTVVTFSIDGRVIYTASCDSSPRSFVVSSWDDDGEINSVEYGYGTPARFVNLANSDGSFTLPIYGAPGDPIAFSARDRHPYPLTSPEVTFGSIPADL